MGYYNRFSNNQRYNPYNNLSFNNNYSWNRLNNFQTPNISNRPDSIIRQNIIPSSLLTRQSITNLVSAPTIQPNSGNIRAISGSISYNLNVGGVINCKSLKGNADTASKLKSPVKIGNQIFDGSYSIDIYSDDIIVKEGYPFSASGASSYITQLNNNVDDIIENKINVKMEDYLKKDRLELLEVDIATTEALDSSIIAPGNIIDGIIVDIDSIILIKNDNDPIFNGIYKFVGNALTRIENFNDASDIREGLYIYVKNGTINSQSVWKFNYDSSENFIFDQSDIVFIPAEINKLIKLLWNN